MHAATPSIRQGTGTLQTILYHIGQQPSNADAERTEIGWFDHLGSNSTHVAVALKDEKDNMAAQIVLTKGYDEVAQEIKAIAVEHDIPMVENIELARALVREVEIAKPVNPKWFKAVAIFWRRCIG